MEKIISGLKENFEESLVKPVQQSFTNPMRDMTSSITAKFSSVKKQTYEFARMVSNHPSPMQMARTKLTDTSEYLNNEYPYAASISRSHSYLLMAASALLVPFALKSTSI